MASRSASARAGGGRDGRSHVGVGADGAAHREHIRARERRSHLHVHPAFVLTRFCPNPCTPNGVQDRLLRDVLARWPTLFPRHFFSRSDFIWCSPSPLLCPIPTSCTASNRRLQTLTCCRCSCSIRAASTVLSRSFSTASGDRVFVVLADLINHSFPKPCVSDNQLGPLRFHVRRDGKGDHVFEVNLRYAAYLRAEAPV